MLTADEIVQLRNFGTLVSRRDTSAASLHKERSERLRAEGKVPQQVSLYRLYPERESYTIEEVWTNPDGETIKIAKNVFRWNGVFSDDPWQQVASV